MSKFLQNLKTTVVRARNLCYYGKYLESASEFSGAISKVESEIFRIDDKNLLIEWNKLLQQLKFQHSYVETLINTLAGKFDSCQSRPTNNATNVVKVQKNSSIHQDPGSKKVRYPFGKEPFKKNAHEDDQIYNRRQRENRELTERERERLEKEEMDRLYEERQAEIWPKKKPVATKKNPQPNNNKSGLQNRDYERPWLKNACKKGKKQKETQGKKSFLKHCYPDGNGPDANLIEMLEREVIDFNPNITFDDIAELEKAKDLLTEAVLLPLAMPDFFTGLRRAWKGVLLFGPPGTGKTLLAKAIASSGKTTFFSVTSSTLASKWKGQSQKMVRLLFQMAHFYAPTTIFIDEIDALASKRGDREDQSSRKVKTEIMTRIDGASSGGTQGEEQKTIVVIGATNRPWDLDEAIRRRLQKRIYIPLPTEKGRKELIKISLKKEKTENIDLDEIVKRTDGYSGADISNLCREAAYMPMRRQLKKEGGLGGKLTDGKWLEEFQKGASVPLCMDDFMEALNNVKPSVGKTFLANYEEWMAEFGEQGTK